MRKSRIIPSNLAPLIAGVGAAVALGVAGYKLFRKSRSSGNANQQQPRVKHSHIRKSKHAHEPSYPA